MISLELSELLQSIIKSIKEAKAPRDLATYLDSQYVLVAETGGIAIVSQEIGEKSVAERLGKIDALLNDVKGKITSEKPSQLFVSLDRWIASLRQVNYSLQPSASSDPAEDTPLTATNHNCPAVS